MTTEWKDGPGWLIDLVKGRWEQPEWRAWEKVWWPELQTLGIGQDRVDPVGDPSRPMAISAKPEAGGWFSSPIHWDQGDAGRAILEAIADLVRQIREASGPGGERPAKS